MDCDWLCKAFHFPVECVCVWCHSLEVIYPSNWNMDSRTKRSRFSRLMTSADASLLIPLHMENVLAQRHSCIQYTHSELHLISDTDTHSVWQAPCSHLLTPWNTTDYYTKAWQQTSYEAQCAGNSLSLGKSTQMVLRGIWCDRDRIRMFVHTSESTTCEPRKNVENWGSRQI